MQPHFTDSATHRLAIAKVAILSPINPRLNPHLDHAVFETCKPILKNFSDLNALHVDCIPNNTNGDEINTVHINS
ncbi:MAG: hypothetical protein ABIO88_00695, partial [Burkholderiaceae bacterium]